MWRALPLVWQLGLEFGLILVVAGFVTFVHHHIWKEGYDAAMVNVKTAEAARLSAAAKDIQEIGVKHAQIRQKNASQPGYSLPACAVAAGAVERLYSRPGRAAKRSARGLHPAPGTATHGHGP